MGFFVEVRECLHVEFEVVGGEWLVEPDEPREQAHSLVVPVVEQRLVELRQLGLHEVLQPELVDELLVHQAVHRDALVLRLSHALHVAARDHLADRPQRLFLISTSNHYQYRLNRLRRVLDLLDRLLQQKRRVPQIYRRLRVHHRLVLEF